MTQASQPVRSSLSARIIRACPKHAGCGLSCPERTVEDVGTIAGFDNRSLIQRVKEALRGITGSER